MEAKWITRKEAEKITGWSRSTILRYIKNGILEKRQVAKNSRIYIDYYSIPSFMRNENAE